MLCLFLTSVFAGPNDTIDPKIVNPKIKDETCPGKDEECIKQISPSSLTDERREGEGCNSR